MQPARQLLRDRGFTVPGVARRYGIPPDQLRNTLRGLVAPTHAVCIALTDALDVPVTELFDADALGRLR